MQQDSLSLETLKDDLNGIEVLLEDKAVDTSDIIGAMEDRESKIQQLQTILPRLAMYDTHRIQ